MMKNLTFLRIIFKKVFSFIFLPQRPQKTHKVYKGKVVFRDTLIYLPNIFLLAIALVMTSCQSVHKPGNQKQEKVDRYALVNRHPVIVTSFDTMSSLSVGNGDFAFTVDPTGLQTFPAYYENGIPLGTESDWGWHSFPNPHHYSLKDVMKNYQVDGREVPYVTAFKSPERKKLATEWLRENPHRIDLGKIGWDIRNENDSVISMNDIRHIHQKLDLWTGEIISHFTAAQEPVTVKTVCDQQEDEIAVHVQTHLLEEGRLAVKIRFPYASTQWDNACDWNSPDKHQTIILISGANHIVLKRIMDTTVYFVRLTWKGGAVCRQIKKQTFEIIPDKKDSVFSFTCSFSQHLPQPNHDDFDSTEGESSAAWKRFWTTGGVVDLSGSTDPRAKELERRIVLSQYLSRIQDAGIYPPQETGLTYNSWYGKFHLEMYFWHESHFALWDHVSLLEKSLSWYQQIASVGRETARRQGYQGIRWPKMTDPSGRESPSPIGPFLIWQEPHIIYMLELCYRDRPNKAFLEKYKDLVFGTADFMASYPWYDSLTKKPAFAKASAGRYVLGPALIPAQERYNRDSTINPTFELAYWYWGLSVAQTWRERLGLSRNPAWDQVMDHLSPLPVQQGVYLAAQSFPDTYTNPRYTTDHPSMLMAYGFLPLTKMADTTIMRATLEKVMKVWNWSGTWGWDYPMAAMTATRAGMPEQAIDALMMPVIKNTYLPDGHNYQRSNLRCYLPGNGSLLTAIALMCAGWDGYKGPADPGFPKNGKWKVRWEGLKKMP